MLRLTTRLLLACVLSGCADDDARVGSEAMYGQHATDRDECRFGAGATSDATIGADAQRPGPDWHVVVLMMENRSFDHYFAGLHDADTTTAESNPDPDSDGGNVEQYPADTYCLPNLNHAWGPTHLQYDNGRMDGFVASSRPHGKQAMAYYTKEDLPFAHWLAEHFAASDRHFASLLGPTWPNRLFMFKATSCGYTEGLASNAGITTGCGAKKPSILSELEEAKVSYTVYDASGLLSVAVGLDVIPDLSRLETFDDFLADAEAGELPSVSFVSGNNGALKAQNIPVISDAEPPQDDDHPKANVQRGQRLIYDVVRALMHDRASFRKTILFITYDEHGGFFDHVPPPPACEPEVATARYDYKFDRYGFRVPLIVVSPSVVKPGYVSSRVTDHTSITRFIEHWQGLGAMTRRDANAWPMLDIFDFTREPLALPELPSEPEVTEACP